MTPGTSEAGRRLLLRRVYAQYQADRAFAHLRAGDNPFVPGDGPMSPRLMFVGEAPGAQEAKLRKPFVGASGKVLDELLASVGLSRGEVFITNVVKYRPPNNRDPFDEERWAGTPYLRHEHRLLGRPPIVMLGKHATKTVKEGYRLPYNMVVGEWTTYDDTPMLPLFHPAYGIYQRANRPLMFEQFKAVLNPPEAHRAAQ